MEWVIVAVAGVGFVVYLVWMIKTLNKADEEQKVVDDWKNENWKQRKKEEEEAIRKYDAEHRQQMTDTGDASAAYSERLLEIKRYKELLDMGAITQEEFEAKKKQLLGL